MRDGLACGPPEEIERLVAWLFTICVARDDEDEDREKLLKAHVFVLKTEPGWAVKAAVTAWSHSEKFRPVPSDLLRRAQAVAKAARDELWEILRLLNAKVYQDPSPDERGRVKTLFAALTAGMEAAQAPGEAAAPARAPMGWPEREAAMLERAREPVRLSPECLAATLPKVREAQREAMEGRS